MDSGTIMIAAGLLLFCIVIFMMLGNKNSSVKKLLQKQLNTISEKQNIQFTRKDFSGNFAIAFSGSSRKIAFIRKNGETLSTDLINIKDVSKVSVVKTLFDNTENIERLAVSCNYKNNSKSEFILFDAASDNFTISGEYQLAEKWKKIIEENR